MPAPYIFRQRHLVRSHCLHKKQVISKGGRQVSNLAGYRIESTIPNRVKTQLDYQWDIKRRNDNEHGRIVQKHTHQEIGKLAKRDHVAMKEVLQAFSEEAKADAEDQTFVTDEILIRTGAPAEVIVQTAKEQKCDLIVMGTHGHGVIADVLIGSTARRVVRESPMPVLVIRLP